MRSAGDSTTDCFCASAVRSTSGLSMRHHCTSVSAFSPAEMISSQPMGVRPCLRTSCTTRRANSPSTALKSGWPDEGASARAIATTSGMRFQPVSFASTSSPPKWI
jgi:hypothetical protein